MNALQSALINAGVGAPGQAGHNRPAPAPLPYVSARARRRVSNALDAPEHCPYCQSPTHFVDHAQLYAGRRYGDWPYALACTGCDAYVGLHPHTDIPLGSMANGPLRQARANGKALFHRLQHQWGWGRSRMYQWLSREMGLSAGECHWGWFNHAQCDQARALCARYLRPRPCEQPLS